MPNKLICVFIFLFVLAGCKSISPDVRNSELAGNFYLEHISLEEMARNFGTYSLEEQYDIYIFGNQVVHPPATFLAHEFAKQGTAIIPFLTKKLKVAQSELTIRDIALVFEDLARLKLYDFTRDQKLMDILDKRAFEMQGPWKPITLEIISRIKSTSGMDNK